ncbi:pH regulation protein F [Alkalibacter rhizosphaerae]|uniref:PH regulation protein F n=1 Tax=Alkalibacter rhizosphaerae TaxID=2815577 RepID=A0A974XFR2_9FIRM|nr:monovalent cation/H+ antiporter complex subunit F [Alkalibacter rhizosphaerae]QSX08998.1 pH regulation protein F [Alkalibacter rhizosphaerae]
MTTLNSTLLVISVYIFLVLIRVIMGPTIWDRLLGLNMITAKIIISIIVLAVLTERSYLLDIALVYSVLGFIGTVLIARFVERKGKI